MATRNIFASVDVNGILAHKKSSTSKTVQEQIVEAYSFDPTAPGIITNQSQISVLQNKANKPPRFGWTDYAQIPDYTRLIASKESSEGYPIAPSDESNGRVTNIYELQIDANVGDDIVWWGHSINPGNNTQCIVSAIQHIRRKSGTGSSSITQPVVSSNNKSFYFASRAASNPQDNYVRVETSSAYTIGLKVPNDWNNNIISYNIELLLLSSPCNTTTYGLMSYPVARLVVDPTINLTNNA